MISIRDIIIAKSFEFEALSKMGHIVTIPQYVQEIFDAIRMLGDKYRKEQKTP